MDLKRYVGDPEVRFDLAFLDLRYNPVEALIDRQSRLIESNREPLASRNQIELWLTKGKDLFHCYTYSEQWIFNTYDPKPTDRYIAIFPIDQPVSGTKPISF